MKFGIASLAVVAVALCSSVVMASPVTGPASDRDTLQPSQFITYNMVLRKGEPTIIAVQGAGRSDIDCVLYDANGNVVDSDTDDTDVCAIVSTPRWTGEFVLKVINVGRRNTAFQLEVR